MSAITFAPVREVARHEVGRQASRPEALRCGIVRRHLGLQALGQIADAAVALTLTRLLLLEMGGANASDVTAGIAVSVMPAVLSLPIAWAIADSLRRNASLAIAHLARSLIALAAVFVPLTSSRAIGFAIIAAITAAQTVTGNLRSASLGHAVASSRLVAANSLAAVTGKIAGAIGLGLVVMLHFTTPFILFGTAAVLHLAAAAGYHTWTTDLGGHDSESLSVRHVVAHASRALLHPLAFRVVPVTIALRAVQGASMMAFVTVLERRYGAGSVTTTAAVGVTSGGVFMGMLLAPNYWRIHRNPTVRRLATVVLLVSTVAAATIPTAGFCLASQFVVSMMFGALRVRADAAMQSGLEPQARGRVVAVYDATYHVAFVLGAVLSVANPYAGRQPSLGLTLALGAFIIVVMRARTLRTRRESSC